MEALEMVGWELPYHAAFYNCEHFAIEMRYGKAESGQINEKPGDLIEINRGLYKHWAIYIGKDEVVHFISVKHTGGLSTGSSANLSSSRGEVKREKLTDVVGNDSYHSNNLLDKECEARDPSIIVKEACEMVGRKLQYNAATYNCEHFATEMRYGKVCI
ncbi:phospholipase A and acyltransferase 4-like [Limanda limanda]|uniref:phospholipase A and acyltransferase 4-like n=1 Tax=Limanda limanda TaxID=27771 RepID=UPI0029C6C1F4|nr:phospholipase A and acyltransferase 4-like [Limanda limanda]